jgi:hypothetical protein
MGTIANQSRMSFEPPTEVVGEDWALVLDDASKDYPPLPPRKKQRTKQ